MRPGIAHLVGDGGLRRSPVACGFYAERADVLGCNRIESISQQSPDVIWGNHAALEERMRELGSAKELSMWLKRS